MLFEWDENKKRINKAKHGISFETAKRVWDDPHVWIHFDRFETVRTDFMPLASLAG